MNPFHGGTLIPSALLKKGYNLQRATWHHWFETCILAQYCGWLPATTGSYTHTFTRSGTPRVLEAHTYEYSSVPRSSDILGGAGEEWHVRCAQGETATQDFSFTGARKVAGKAIGSLAEPTPHAEAAYRWENLSGLMSLKYNNTDVDIEITGLDLWLKSNYAYYMVDGGDTTNQRVITTQDAGVTLTCMPTDAGNVDLFTLIETDPSAYAGDLDAIVEFEITADTKEVTFTYDKLYVLRDFVREIPDIQTGAMKVELPMSLNVGGSLVIAEDNALDNTYYGGT